MVMYFLLLVKSKTLVITFDSNLSATSHAMSVVVTANQRVNLLLRLFLTCNKSVLLSVLSGVIKNLLRLPMFA